MNLTGNLLYSKATAGLRDPKNIIKDNQFKLVYIYPMLIDSKLQGEYGNMLRDFMAVSMLKEIFVSNALNIVAMASNDYPLSDERGNKIDTHAMISKTVATGYPGMDKDTERQTLEIPSNRPKVDPYELKQRIQEKTAMIKKYLATEPRMKTLNPYVELITLENMIDVPVIVGTKAYPSDTLSLAFLISVALAHGRRLDNRNDIDYIFRVMRNIDPADSSSLFVGMVNKTQKKQTGAILNWIENSNSKVAGITRAADKYLLKPMARFTGLSKPEPTAIYVKDRTNTREQTFKDFVTASADQSRRGQFDILNVLKSDIDDLQLYFKFMTEPALLANQFGLKKDYSQLKTATQKISVTARGIFEEMEHTFASYMSTIGNAYMQSCAMLMWPHQRNLDYISLKGDIIDNKMFTDLFEKTEEVAKSVEQHFHQGTPQERENDVKVLTKICSKTLGDVQKRIQRLGESVAENRVHGPYYTLNDYVNFTEHALNAMGEFSTQIAIMKKQVVKIMNAPKEVLEPISTIIDNRVDEFYNEIWKNLDSPDYYNSSFKVNTYVKKEKDTNGNVVEKDEPIIDDNDAITEAMSRFREGTANWFKMLYMYSLMEAICKFSTVIDISLETVKNDALDLPNYSLVIPLETVAMLHAAVIAKNWRTMIKSEESQNTNLTDNYIKGIVKFVTKRLDIPNLFVIDTKKNQIFYKLQYMSVVHKSNLNTFKTFVAAMTSTELENRNSY